MRWRGRGEPSEKRGSALDRMPGLIWLLSSVLVVLHAASEHHSANADGAVVHVHVDEGAFVDVHNLDQRDATVDDGNTGQDAHDDGCGLALAAVTLPYSLTEAGAVERFGAASKIHATIAIYAEKQRATDVLACSPKTSPPTRFVG